VVRLFNSFGWVAAEKPLLTLILDMLIGGVVGLVVLLTLDSQLRKVLKVSLQRTHKSGMEVGGTLFGSQPQPKGDKG
jgi:hypothetical protein